LKILKIIEQCIQRNFQGYDVMVDNAETCQQMCTPMLLPKFGPKIKDKIKKKITKLITR